MFDVKGSPLRRGHNAVRQVHQDPNDRSGSFSPIPLLLQLIENKTGRVIQCTRQLSLEPLLASRNRREMDSAKDSGRNRCEEGWKKTQRDRQKTTSSLPSHTQEGQPLLSKKKSSVGATVKWQKVMGGSFGNGIVFSSLSFS